MARKVLGAFLISQRAKIGPQERDLAERAWRVGPRIASVNWLLIKNCRRPSFHACASGWKQMQPLSRGEVGGSGLVKAYRDGLAIAERLAAADRSNTLWQKDLQLSISRIGGIAANFILA